MGVDKERFLEILREPTRLVEFDLRQWDAILPMANQLEMLPHFVAQLDTAGLSGSLPGRVTNHLESARTRSRRHRHIVLWEVEQLDSLFADLAIPIVLLKGAAYLLNGLDVSLGRVYSDIDIMVPKTAIRDVEQILKRHGWEQPEELIHQEQYFRRWMHELLPLTHKKRGTTIDLHHNILPSIDRLEFDPKTLFKCARPLKAGSCIHVLAPVDMVLHNIVHLFRNGRYYRAFRDLVDLDRLLREFALKEEDFYEQFKARVEEFNLLTPCFLAFRYAHKYLHTDLPADVLEWVEKGKPNWPPIWLLDRLFEYASFPTRITGNENARRYSLWLLERYPLNLLRKSILPKLERKGIVIMNPRI